MSKYTRFCGKRWVKDDWIVSWLKDAQISEDKKRFITKKTELLKGKI